jgi:MoaA/NifB/PqqE/SkfB family radical SAM enzyme
MDGASCDPLTRNLQISREEYRQRAVVLRSRPRCLGMVLGNACNLRCIHCYQPHDGAQLLAMAPELRDEMKGLYPYLSTLRLQGGEVLAMKEFGDLVEDLACRIRRPILSISTNATLLDDVWAERMVRLPFSSVTVSIDGATQASFNRLRRGVDRLAHWKRRLGREFPCVDCFFVVMRSNFREIPQYLELMAAHGMADVALQLLELAPEALRRTPSLAEEEAIADPREIAELHSILLDVVPRFRRTFRLLRVAGMQSLFEGQGLLSGFLDEPARGLYPDSDGLSEHGFDLCPNPWTTLFVTENGDAHLCFNAEPIGNVRDQGLMEVWNSPAARRKREAMVAGKYLESGCSAQYCGWREAPPVL